MEPEELFIKRFSELIEKGDYTLEDIGHAIGLKSKGTISKYMSGDIKNIKRSQIVKLANLFSVSPAWLAGFSDDKYENIHKTLNEKFIEEAKDIYGIDSIQLLDNYSKLNNLGKKTANQRVEELTEVPKYTEKNELSEENTT